MTRRTRRELKEALDELEGADDAQGARPEGLSEKEREHLQQMLGDDKEQLSPEQREELNALGERIDAEGWYRDGDDGRRRGELTGAAKRYLAIVLDGEPET